MPDIRFSCRVSLEKVCMTVRILASILCLGAGVLPTLAQPSLSPLSAPTTDPAKFSSLRLDPFESVAPAEGTWVTTVQVSYFNQWNGTWHTRRIHEGLGRHRQPIGDDEIVQLERAFPDDEIYRFDIEGSRLDLHLARGLARGRSIAVRVPWILIGSPNGDNVAEAFHSVIPADDHYVRELFARDQTFFYLRTGGRSVVRRQELERSGFGDIAISLGLPLTSRGRASQRLALTAEFPTGRRETLHGSGGVDVGLRWFLARQGTRNDMLVGAGVTRNDDDGAFLGFRRSDTWHVSADWLRRVSGRMELHLGVRVDSSPLAEATRLNLGDPVVYYRLGLQREVIPGHGVTFDIGDEIAPQGGVDADFSFHLGWIFVPPDAMSPR